LFWEGANDLKIKINNMPEKIIKKEDKLEYTKGILLNRRGTLVLTTNELYFIKKDKKLFSSPLNDIVSVNAKKGIGNGVEWLIIVYNSGGKEQTAKIHHFGFFNGIGLGILSRMTQLYFASWEKAINDARFGQGENNNGLNNLEKLAELKEKGILNEEEFNAKKKQILGL
jgi:hypothetical protein